MKELGFGPEFTIPNEIGRGDMPDYLSGSAPGQIQLRKKNSGDGEWKYSGSSPEGKPYFKWVSKKKSKSVEENPPDNFPQGLGEWFQNNLPGFLTGNKDKNNTNDSGS